MTVVAALARAGRVVMAADTCTNYQGTHVLGARKIARITVGDDDALLAASGSGALLGLHTHWSSAAAPDPDDPADVQAWAHEAARALSELAAAQTPPLLADAGGGTQIVDGAFLLGWRGRLIYFFTHQGVVLPDGIGALGMGADYAFGALEVGLAGGWADPEGMVEAAVLGACGRYDGCRVAAEGPQVEHLPAVG